MIAKSSASAILLSLAVLITFHVSEATGAPPATPPPAFGDFIPRVQQYLKLHNDAPRLRTTRKREETVERRQALAQKIRDARADAKPGDIFTPEIAGEFRQAIQSAFQGPGAASVRKTIRQGEPLQGWHLIVNGDYPEHLPVTTIPPTLLLKLPELPAEIEYRIIGHDFVLEDTHARLIVDFIPGALP